MNGIDDAVKKEPRILRRGKWTVSSTKRKKEKEERRRSQASPIDVTDLEISVASCSQKMRSISSPLLTDSPGVSIGGESLGDRLGGENGSRCNIQGDQP